MYNCKYYMPEIEKVLLGENVGCEVGSKQRNQMPAFLGAA